VLRDLADASLDPRRFFASLRARPPSARRAFAALLLPLALGALVQLIGLGPLLESLDPALARTLERLGPVVLRVAFLVGALLGVPLAALVLWLVAWLPLRLAAGARPRLGEVAAWTQVPNAVVRFVPVVAGALGVALPPPIGLLLGLAGTGWSAWLVYEGLGAFAADARTRGLLAWLALQALIHVLAFLLAAPGFPGASGRLVL